MSIKYQYKLVLTLANRQIKIDTISKEIEESFKEFNIRSISSRNPKEIVKCEIKADENLLYIWLNSNSKIDSSPLRVLNLFTKLIIEQLSNDSQKKMLLNNIIRNKCFFKLAQEPKQITNLKLESSDKKETQEPIVLNNDEKVEEKENNFTILTNDLSGNKELRKKLMTMIKFGLNCLEDLDNDKISQKNRDLINKFDDLKGGDE